MLNWWIKISASAVLVALLVTLSFQNKSLREGYQEASEKNSLPYVGMFVPEVPTIDSQKHLVRLGAPSNKTQLIFVFNTHCPHCKATIPAVRQVWEGLAHSEEVELVALSQDTELETTQYLDEQSFETSFVSGQSRRFLSLFHATGVPVLMLIDQEGKVVYTKAGEININDAETVISAVSRTGA